MRKSARQPSDSSPRGHRKAVNGNKSGSAGRWEFTASGSLFALGATAAARRAAYRTATGELRFLPL